MSLAQYVPTKVSEQSDVDLSAGLNTGDNLYWNGTKFVQSGTATARGVLKDVWITIRGDTRAGTGTLNDPFDGSTQAKFDAIIASYYSGGVTNVAFHLGAYSFSSKGSWGGNWLMLDGWHFIGAGKYLTTIVQVPGATDPFNLGLFNHATAHNNYQSIENLTIDLAYNRSHGVYNPATTFSGAQLSGQGSYARNVRVLNCGSDAAADCFAILIDSFASDSVTHNTFIENCEVSSCGPNVNALSLANSYSLSVYAHNGRTIGCLSDGAKLGMGIPGNFDSGEVAGNTILNFSYAGLFQDTMPYTGIHVHHNTITNLDTSTDHIGITSTGIANGADSVFDHNTITANNGIQIDGASLNTTIESNRFIFVAGGNGRATTLNGSGVVNTIVRNNNIDASFTRFDTGATGTWYKSNTLPDGSPHPNYPDTDPVVSGVLVAGNLVQASSATAIEDAGIATVDVVDATADNTFTGSNTFNNVLNTFEGTNVNTEVNISAISSGTAILSLFGAGAGDTIVAVKASTALRFGTVSGTGGAGLSEKARITPSGGFAIGSTTNVTAGNLLVSGLTASQFLQTDASKVLVSKTASQMRTDLSLVPGTNVQVYSANLDTVAAISVNAFGAGFLASSTALQMRTYVELDYLFSGIGSPEGAVTAPVGSRYRRTNGGAGTCLYVKETGSGNTGWVAYTSGTAQIKPAGTTGQVPTKNSNADYDWDWADVPGSGGGGTVTDVSVVTANGISGSVATSTSTPAITLTLGAITPTSVVASGNLSGANLSGTNTGDQTITLTGDVTGSGTGSFAATIGANKVTLAKLATQADQTFLGNNSGGTAVPSALSVSTVIGMLSLEVGVDVQEWSANLDNLSGATIPSGNLVGDTDSQSLTNKTIVSQVISTGLTATGSASNDFSGSTGTFKTSTGANTLSGAVTITGTTPSLTTASGQTNTGFIQINGKTSGGLKFLPVDAAAQLVTVSLAQQTVGASVLTIPDFANVNDTFVFAARAATLTNKTLTSPKLNENVAVTSTATQVNYLSAATGTTGTTSTNLVFSTSPTLVTPTLGVATATSVNKWAFTAPATSATLVSGADNLTYTLPEITCNIGFREIPQNSKSAAYTTVLADNGKHIFHPSADTTARTFTIDSNANVPYPVGTAIMFVNQNSAGVVTIAIAGGDTLRLAGAGTIGSRTLAANGIATALKVASTSWLVSGTGLS